MSSTLLVVFADCNVVMLVLAEIFTVIVAVLVVYLSWYLYSLKRTTASNENGQALYVISVVEAIQKVCPVGFRKNWVLLKSDTGTPRCWKREFSLKILSHSHLIYGCSTVVKGSSLETLRMIANTTNWPEWKPNTFPGDFSLQTFNEPNLREDNFMRSAKVLSKQGQLESYRFSHLSLDNLGWLLFWHVNKIDWCFYLVQPLFKKEIDCCMLTYIFGQHPPLKDASSVGLLICTVNGIRDAVEMNLVHVIPVCLPFSTTRTKLHCVCVRRDCKKCQKRRPSQVSKNGSVVPSKVFKLVPSFKKTEASLKNLRSFTLHTDVCQRVLKCTEVPDSSENISSSCSQDDDEPQEANAVHIFSKSSSLPELRPTTGRTPLLWTDNVKTSNQLLNKELPSDVLKKKHSSFDNGFTLQKEDSESKFLSSKQRSSTVAVLPDVETKIVKSVKGRSLSEVNLASHTRKLSSTMRSSCGSLENLPECDEDSIEPCSSEENSSINFSPAKNDRPSNCHHLDPADAIPHQCEFEVLLPDLEMSAQRLTSMITNGNYSASELQAEVLEASYINIQTSIEDQPLSSKGWSFHSTNKGITLLSKVTRSGHFKILSYICETEIGLKAADVWKVVKNPNSRFICDESVKKVRIMEDISCDQKIVYTYHESSHLLKRETVDFCLLHTERQEKSKHYLAIQSIEYENCPLMDAVTRGMLLPSGWVVHPSHTDSKNTVVVYLYQILVSNPGSLFIQDLSHSVPLYLYNLKKYVMLQPS